MDKIKEQRFNFKLMSNLILTLLIGAFPLYKFWNWLVIDSVWSGSAQDCRNSSGACLSYFREKSRFILLGFYPEDQHWRPILFIISCFILLFYLALPHVWERKEIKKTFANIFCFICWSWIILHGGHFGLEIVDSSDWAGLPLTLVVAGLGNLLSLPYGIFLAFCRQSRLPVVKGLALIHIETIRGVPLITLLFMVSLMFPLVLPEALDMSKLTRVIFAFVIFSGSYLAEVIRGGLQDMDAGQVEAANSLGLSRLQTIQHIILPQTLRKVFPSIIQTMISNFKDTSLVIIISLMDLMSTTRAALNDPQWGGLALESYLMTAIIYFSLSYALGRIERVGRIGIKI